MIKKIPDNHKLIQPKPLQMPLLFDCDPCEIKSRLQYCLGREVFLTITNNRTVYVSCKLKEGRFFIRLHHIFLRADEKVIHAIVGLANNKRYCRSVIRAFIDEHRQHLKHPVRGIKNATPSGVHYDLKEIFNRLNNMYFENRLNAFIYWSYRHCKGAVRRRTLGSYHSPSSTIRISALLDSKDVPEYFVSFVVYHEMLHADMGTIKNRQRRIIHSKEFRVREMLFHDYQRAIKWEKGNL